MNMEMKKIGDNEVRKSAKEGGLEEGIQKMKDKISSLISMINQIELLQRIPAGYKNLAGEGKINTGEIPALDQNIDYRVTYDNLQLKSEEGLSTAYQTILEQLTLLRDMTGVHNVEETLKFNKDTGRQLKDN